MSAAYRLGAVVYHPKVEQIWHDFGGWFAEQGFPLAPVYFERYDDQVDALVAGELDTAWNTNLAHVQTLERTAGAADALAMRDTDRGWVSHIVALEASGLSSLEELRGRRVGFGDSDSPQAQILPVHALRAQGFDPERDFRATRLDRDVGKHGDPGELLFSMDIADPKLCEPMELEYVNAWVAFDPTGYADLIEAVAAGPAVVGAAEVVR